MDNSFLAQLDFIDEQKTTANEKSEAGQEILFADDIFDSQSTSLSLKEPEKSADGSDDFTLNMKPLRLTRLVKALLNELQVKGSIDKGDFINDNGFTMERRRLSDIISVLEFLDIAKVVDKKKIVLNSPVRTDPPIDVQYLEEEIEKLEKKIRIKKETNEFIPDLEYNF